MAQDPNNKEKGPSAVPPKLNIRPQGNGESTPAGAEPSKSVDADAPKPSAAQGGDEFSQTMHIQVPEEKPEEQDAGQDAGQTPASKPSQEAGSPTVKMQKPPSAGGKPPASAPGGGVKRGIGPKSSAKKETSKIPLDIARALNKQEPEAGEEAKEQTAGEPKTVRLQPKAQQKAGAQPPSAQAQKAPAAGGAGEEGDEKRKTSRISLDAVLSESDSKESGGGGSGPKTIKLKPPTEAGTVKVAQGKPSAPVPSAGQTKDQTTQLDEAAPPETEGQTPTKRKTIKVARGPGKKGAKGIKISRDQQQESAAKAQQQVQAPVEQPSVVFPVFAVAAVLVICVTIWMLAAQTFGPNISLTQLSYGAPGMDLPWPNKIQK
ncbi:MAG: hypothetical protein R6V03_10840 [Kiritimatiellia bacterium]